MDSANSLSEFFSTLRDTRAMDFSTDSVEHPAMDLHILANSSNAWLDSSIYENSDKTVAQVVTALLKIFVENASSKSSLYFVLNLVHTLLPQPNNLPQNKYYLMKLINSVLPNDGNLIQNFRVCEDCSYYCSYFWRNFERNVLRILQGK